MNDAKTTQPTYYNSCYRHGLDEKRRVQIPAKWRPEEEGGELTLMVWKGHPAGACLRVLPPEELAKLVAEINALPKGDPKKAIMKRTLGSESVQVTLDKAGRICVPEDMANAAGLQAEVMLVGLFDRFEIWQPGRYAQVKAADEPFAAKAYELME